MSRLRIPGATGRAALGVAAVAWVGALLGLHRGVVGLVVGLAGAALAAGLRRWLIAAVVVCAAVSGWAAASRVDATLDARVQPGPVVFAGRIADEPVRGGATRAVLDVRHRLVGGSWVPADHPNVAVMIRKGEVPTAGDHVVVRGMLQDRPTRVRGDPAAGVVVGASVEVVASSSNPLFTVGNAMRRRVAGSLEEDSDPRAALMSGFLIGDTAGLAGDDVEALRRAGLSHFVAVSGSNVALFLAAWWVLTAPLALSARVRSLTGLVGLALFVIITRWEPSVVRAATMAGLVLGGRAIGQAIDAWTALGVAVTGLLLISGDLATSVGFQLSVAATLGVMAGASMFAGRRPRWLFTALGATIAAQIAVVPLLLGHFGTVPVFSPLANLLAAPLVTGATALGGIGVVVGLDPLTDVGLILAGGVLAVARTASGWAQVGPGAVAAIAGLVFLARWRATRPALAAAAVVVVAGFVVPPSAPEASTVTFLDVGQGDAVLLQDGSGTSVLIDGGRDPGVLRRALGRRGVRHLDLVVLTHGDADHAGGLVDLAEHVPTGALWLPRHAESEGLIAEVAEAAMRSGTAIARPDVGTRATVGSFSLRVEGPLRRYAAANNGSLVLWVEAAGRTLLLPGDIEALAQHELPPFRPDLLLVPHHGSATTDLEWLADTVGPWAVISVGENSYGHPAVEVVSMLQAMGTEVWITRDHGDIRIPFG